MRWRKWLTYLVLAACTLLVWTYCRVPKAEPLTPAELDVIMNWPEYEQRLRP